MRVGFYFPALNYGGHEEVACRVIELLMSCYEIEIYCSYKNKALIKKINTINNSKKIIVHNLIIKNTFGFSRHGLLNSIEDFINLYKLLIKNKKIDRFISIDGGFGASLLALLAPRLCGVKVISYLPLFQTDLENSLTVKLYSIIFLNKIITISESIKRRLEDTVVPKIIVVNNVISSLNYSSHNQILSGKKKILFLGRIDFHQKQQNKFVNFIIKHSKYFQEFTIDFYGDGVERDILIDQVKNSSLHNVRIKEWDEWKSNFHLYAVTMLYSDYEGEPVVFVDSILNNVPVICPENLVDLNLVPSQFTFLREDITSFKKAVDCAISDKSSYKKIKNDLLKNREETAIKNQWIEALK